MTPAGDIARDFATSLAGARYAVEPFPHWLIQRPFGQDIGRALADLPFAPPLVGDTNGRRETHNSTRIFFDQAQQTEHPICRAVGQAFQSSGTADAIERATGADLQGTSLRIEYCLDLEGFWLEPHTDIGAKRFTMLIYLSDDLDAEAWGTDLYSGPDTHHSRVRATFDTGLIFIPSSDTWHGFGRRPISGVRRSLIINYVGPEWRARHELAFPDQPVRRE